MAWKKGESGNRKGRPRRTEKEKMQVEQFREQLQMYSVEALETRVNILRYSLNQELQYKVGIYILNRTFGTEFVAVSDLSEDKTINLVMNVVKGKEIDSQLADKEVSQTLSEGVMFEDEKASDVWNMLSDDEQDDWDGWDEDIYIPENK